MTRRNFTSSIGIVPKFKDCMLGTRRHLSWLGGREWLKTLCGRERASQKLVVL